MAVPHGHLPKEFITVCSPAPWPLPAPAEPEPPDSARKGVGRTTESPASTQPRGPRPRPGRLCHPLVPPEVTASSSVRSEPPKEGREGASRRVEEVREGAFQAHCPHLVEAQGPDSPDLAPASPPQGISTSSDDWVEWPL